VSNSDALIVVALMALVTLATRFGGIFFMSFMPLSTRVDAFLRYLAGSVFVALVVPAVARGGPAAIVAVSVSVVAVLVTRKALVSMALGVAAAALYRALA